MREPGVSDMSAIALGIRIRKEEEWKAVRWGRRGLIFSKLYTTPPHLLFLCTLPSSPPPPPPPPPFIYQQTLGCSNALADS